MTLNVEGAEFDNYTENVEELMRDFMDFVVTEVPFFALQDQLLYLMNKRSSTRFKIHGDRTVDHKDHIFYFRLKTVPENPRLRIYHYLGMDLERKGIRP